MTRRLDAPAVFRAQMALPASFRTALASLLMTATLVTALALPAAAAPMRLAPDIPTILSPSDEALYRDIFAAQDRGDWATADRLLPRIQNDILMGHVEFQRYMHPTAYKASFAELRDWLARYSDHPGAFRAHWLAMKRKPKAAPDPVEPVYDAVFLSRLVGERPRRIRHFTEDQSRIRQEVMGDLSRDHITKALEIVEDKKNERLLGKTMADELLGEVALAYYTYGLNKKAYDVAAKAARRSELKVMLAHWVAGLAAFREGWYRHAALHFHNHALSPLSSPWNVSAGAYWAARSSLYDKKPAEVSKLLRLAASKPYTFYGMLARRALGEPIDRNWERPLLTPADIARVRAFGGGERALALIQIGRRDLADEELLPTIQTADAVTTRSIIAVAEVASLPQAAVRGGYRLNHLGALSRDRALYPVPPWHPADGFQLDRALVYAFMRQESVFNPRATSYAGARGLMQLMPATANYISEGSPFKGAERDRLYKPALNMALGQDYLQYLLNKDFIDGNLFKLAIAYNAGIGNLARWLENVDYLDDPLLFIESVPNRESRIFIERVMANLWLYRARLGQETPSLDAIAAGEWPLYAPLDSEGVAKADDADSG